MFPGRRFPWHVPHGCPVGLPALSAWCQRFAARDLWNPERPTNQPASERTPTPIQLGPPAPVLCLLLTSAACALCDSAPYLALLDLSIPVRQLFGEILFERTGLLQIVGPNIARSTWKPSAKIPPSEFQPAVQTCKHNDGHTTLRSELPRSLGRQMPLNWLQPGVFPCLSRPSHTNLASVAQPSPRREFG